MIKIFDFENLQNVKTVGAFIVNDSKFAFMIGSNASKVKMLPGFANYEYSIITGIYRQSD